MRLDGSETFILPLDQILEDGEFNIRIFYGDIDQLAIQLMTEGQHEPVKVRREADRFFIVDGHRRQRAFARARSLRIECVGGRHRVFDGDQPIREAPGPLHRNFDPEHIRCRLVDALADGEELFASQLIYNSGKPFTLLERMIFISRLARLGTSTKEQLALRTGFSRTHIANAQSLNAADPRLLDYVRQGRLSQKLALRLLRVFPPEQQIAQVTAAMASAERHHRDKILPKDLRWGGPAEDGENRPNGAKETVDPVRARLHGLVTRLGDTLRFAANPAAQDRLETLLQIYQYTQGKLSYAKIEARLLGRG